VELRSRAAEGIVTPRGPVTWDRTRARNQGRALRRALADEVRASVFGFGEMMRRAEVATLGDLEGRVSLDHRASWRVGHHAGRLFALREALNDVRVPASRVTLAG
jgi:hypothetical protein